MNLSIKVMSEDDTIDSCLMFQNDEATLYWKKPLFNVYPFLDQEKGLNATWDDRKQYLTQELSNYYCQAKEELNNKAHLFDKHWIHNQEKIIKIFSDVFKIDCNSVLSNMLAEVSINPICPRDLQKKGFTIFYKSDENNFLETALHESIHFVWFYIWQKHFNDDEGEYEGPHLKWVLSEMVVDTFVNHSDIGSFFSTKAHNYAAYKYFYSMQIGNVPILETMANFYKKSKMITDFMEKSYKYCQDNEAEIRSQML